MKKLTAKSIIEFKNKGKVAKASFILAMKSNAPTPQTKKGGDYWTTSISAITKAYKTGNSDVIHDKIEELSKKMTLAKSPVTKGMYKTNIDNLQRYLATKIDEFKPKQKLEFQIKQKGASVIEIKELPVQAQPNLVYTFKKNKVDYIGAIWFVIKKKGFSDADLGVFSEISYRYLKKNYSKDYTIDTDYCIVFDIGNGSSLSHTQLVNKEVPAILLSTIDEIKSML